MIKVLNLYAGIGGNRKLWKDVEVTAVENEPQIAKAYKYFFPQDRVIIANAHTFLLNHYKDYEFIWSSPPCPTHSVLGKMNQVTERVKPIYPDMTLYQEILLLMEFCKCKWVVENTKSYYEPLIKPYISGNHYFWSNFYISNMPLNERRAVNEGSINQKMKRLGYDLSGLSFNQIEGSHKKDKVLNNCVEPELGLFVFNCAFKDIQLSLNNVIEVKNGIEKG